METMHNPLALNRKEMSPIGIELSDLADLRRKLEEEERNVHRMNQEHRRKQTESMQQIDALKSKLIDTQETLTQTLCKMKKLNARITSKEATVSRAKSEYQVTINNLEQKLVEQQVDIEHYQNNKEDHLREIESLRISNKQLEDQLDGMRHSLNDITNIQEELESDIAMKQKKWNTKKRKLRSTLVSLEKSNETLMKRNDSLKKENGSMKERYDSLKEQFSNLLLKSTEKESRCMILQNTLMENKTSLEEMTAIAMEFDSFCDVLNELNQTLKTQKRENELVEFGQFHHDHFGRFETDDTHKGETLKKSVISLKEIISCFHDQNQLKQSQIVSLRGKESNQRKENESLRQDIASLMNQKRYLQSKYDEISLISAQNKQNEMMLRSKYQTLKQQFDSLWCKYESAEKGLETAQSDVMRKGKCMDEMERNFAEYRQVMESKHNELRLLDQELQRERERVDTECIQFDKDEEEEEDAFDDEFDEETVEESKLTRQFVEDFAEGSKEYQNEIAELKDILEDYNESNEATEVTNIMKLNPGDQRVISLQKKMSLIQTKIDKLQTAAAKPYVHAMEL